MTPHRIKVEPVRVHYDDERLVVEVMRVVGYRAGCSCGWRGRIRKSVKAAREEWSEHVVRP